MKTLPARLPRIGGRRVVLSTAMAIGGVLVIGSLAWACTPLVHFGTFQLAPAGTTCEDTDNDGVDDQCEPAVGACEDPDGDGADYQCDPFRATLAGHAAPCDESNHDNNTRGCEAEEDVYELMTPALSPHQLVESRCSDNDTKIGTMTVTALHEVNAPQDPGDVNGWWYAGESEITPKVVDDGSTAGWGHDSGEVRYYKVCEPPDGEAIIGLVKL